MKVFSLSKEKDLYIFAMCKKFYVCYVISLVIKLVFSSLISLVIKLVFSSLIGLCYYFVLTGTRCIGKDFCFCPFFSVALPYNNH